MPNLFLYILSFTYLACVQKESGTTYADQSRAPEAENAPFIHYTDNGCIYYRPHQGDSLMAVAQHDKTLILLKREKSTDTILCKTERMEIKDVQLYENKCIVVYYASFALSYLVLMKSPQWAVIYEGGGYTIPGIGVGVKASQEEIKNMPSVSLIRSHRPLVKIASENELYVSDDLGKQYCVRIDYLNQKVYKIKYFKADSAMFSMANVGSSLVVLAHSGASQLDTIWQSHETNLDFPVDTIISKGNIAAFVTLYTFWKYANSKLSYTYHAFQWDGQVWKPVLEKNIGLYKSHPAEVKSVKQVAYNKVEVISSDGRKTLVEFNLATRTEKRTKIEE